MIVFLSGLSGAGKTTTAAAFIARHAQFKHVVASRLIEIGGASTRPLGAADVAYNQQVLIQGFSVIRHRCQRYHLILDGHMVIETRQGHEIVNDEVIDGLLITHFVVLIDEPQRIYSTRRRSSITTPEASMDEIRRLQALEIDATRRQAERCRCPFFEVQSGQVDALEAVFALRG
jgi:adenylate kinase